MSTNLHVGHSILGALTALFMSFLVFVLGIFLLFATLFLGDFGVYLQKSSSSPDTYNLLLDYLFLIIQSSAFIVSSFLIIKATWIKNPSFAKGFLLLLIPIAIFAIFIITNDLSNCYKGPIGTRTFFGGGTCSSSL